MRKDKDYYNIILIINNRKHKVIRWKLIFIRTDNELSRMVSYGIVS